MKTRDSFCIVFLSALSRKKTSIFLKRNGLFSMQKFNSKNTRWLSHCRDYVPTPKKKTKFLTNKKNIMSPLFFFPKKAKLLVKKFICMFDKLL